MNEENDNMFAALFISHSQSIGLAAIVSFFPASWSAQIRQPLGIFLAFLSGLLLTSVGYLIKLVDLDFSDVIFVRGASNSLVLLALMAVLRIPLIPSGELDEDMNKEKGKDIKFDNIVEDEKKSSSQCEVKIEATKTTKKENPVRGTARTYGRREYFVFLMLQGQ